MTDPTQVRPRERRFGPLAVHSVPGHAPDHLAFVCDGACFTGDVVLGEGSVFVAEDLGPYLAALESHPAVGVCFDTCHAWAAGHDFSVPGGMTATIDEWLMAAEHIAQRGNLDIVLCERGIRTFEPATRTTLDISAVPVVQAFVLSLQMPELTVMAAVVLVPDMAVGKRPLIVVATAAVVGAAGSARSSVIMLLVIEVLLV